MSQHPIEGMIGVSMEKIRDMVDVDTIIGTPITTPDGTTTIIPVSKVSFGFGSGGTDWPTKSEKEVFGGGSGAGITIHPLAFLVVSGSQVTLLQIEEDGGCGIDKLVESVPTAVEKLIEVFKKKGEAKDKE